VAALPLGRRPRCALSALASGACALLIGQAALTAPGDSLADPPHALSVTVYRSPTRESGSFDLDDLDGFALVTETRTVHLPKGLSRLRFEGVADGIEPASAIVSGLPDGVIEKNRDARLLSPSALLAAALGKSVELRRTNRRTGKLESRLGTLLSDAEGGVVFQTAEGIEALRCSGLPETFRFDPPADLSARPTLSVRVRSATAITRQVTLSYLATGFDWAATYTATLSPDGKTLDLGAWVTLANGNGTGFAQAHAQVVAGRLNRENEGVEPIELGTPILAKCWPRGSTSDSEPAVMSLARSRSLYAMKAAAPVSAAALQEVIVTGARQVQQEQLGDLKLYRVPDRTTVAARQSKQVRLLDRALIPVKWVYGFSVTGDEQRQAQPANRWLRTHNTAANHLGIPLPSGSVEVYSPRGGEPLLEHESELPDLAVDEEVEIALGNTADVEVEVHDEDVQVDSARAKEVPLLPGVALRSVKTARRRRVEITNALPREIDFELRLLLESGEEVVGADRPLGSKNGRPQFRLSLPAEGTLTLHYLTRHTQDSVGRTP
jgi:hypothetical protein